MEKILDFRHFGILISGFAYAIIAVGKRENKSMRTQKNEALSTANTEGFFLLFIVDRKTTRLVLSLFVSIKPFDDVVAGYTSRTGNKKRENNFHGYLTSSRCRVSVGQQYDYNTS